MAFHKPAGFTKVNGEWERTMPTPTTSELLNTLVTEMAAVKGYAYTTGYLQSLAVGLSYGLSKKSTEIFRKDMEAMIRKIQEEQVEVTV